MLCSFKFLLEMEDVGHAGPDAAQWGVQEEIGWGW